MLEGNIDWLTNTPFLTKERGFFIANKARGFYADPYKHCWATDMTQDREG
jgi:hypothetical protein